MSGSKTKYYVSSSCSPIFDNTKRVNQMEAALLDYTANSPIEYSEYMKNYFNVSRLRNYRGYNKWCSNSKFTEYFGKVTSSFYGDAVLNNEEITKIIQNIIPHTPSQELTAYSSNLAFFSEDFYIKVLATQQNKADLVYQVIDSEYEISYPTPTSIKATFNSGEVIEGPLPVYSANTRFIEVSYSIIEQQEIIPPPPEPDPDPDPTLPPLPPPKPIIKFKTTYGFYLYQEETGNAQLDSIIKNNGIKGTQTFYSPIPLRADTAWFTGEKATHIGKALQFLELFDIKKAPEEVYKELQKACTDGMKEGNIGDIDYITLLLGVSANSLNQSDLRYIYEFFHNLHNNYALSQGIAPGDINLPKSLSKGSNYLGSFGSRLGSWFKRANYSDSYFHDFVINNSASNLHLTYSWAGSDYFEYNGQFKPDAKPGEYGILNGTYTYHYIYHREYRNSDGDWVEEDIPRSVSYSASFFCHQISKTRWNFLLFIDLGQRNLVYHGKSIYSNLSESFDDAGSTATVSHDFTKDFPNGKDDYHQFSNLRYVTAEGDFATPFIIPLEEKTFKEVGARNELEIAYGSQFLLFNCWVKVRKKWYQRGFFSVVLSFIGTVIGVVLTFICPWIGLPVLIYFGVIFTMAFSAWALATALKVLTAIFGDHLGMQIYNFLKGIVTVIAAIIGKIPVIGWAIAAVIMFSMTSGEALNNGESLWSAFRKGVGAGAVAAVASYAGGAAGGAAKAAGFSASVIDSVYLGTFMAVSSFGGALVQGSSFKSALKSGLISGALTFGLNLAMGEFTEFLKANGIISSTASSGTSSSLLGATEEEIALQHATWEATNTSMTDIIKGSFEGFGERLAAAIVKTIKNPNTFVELTKIGLEEANYHKMANIENDYQEFSNKYASAMKTYYEVSAKATNTITADFICKLQSCIGRYLTIFPDMGQGMTPDNFLTLATASSSDLIKGSLGSITSFADTKLTLDGYTPAGLHYSKLDYTLTWDI